MKLSKTQFVIIAIVLFVLIIGVLIFFGVIPGLRSTSGNKTDSLTGNLNVWGVFDNEASVNQTLVSEFLLQHPNVTISYKSIDPRTYEQDLVNALAAGTGPDVFMVKNTWLQKHANKLSPLDPTAMTVVNYGELFPQVAVKDFVKNGSIYAMPLYIDTLAILYNKNMFDSAGIAQIPKTWEEFNKLVPQLRSIDQETGDIITSTAAIGGSNKNVNEANDLLFQIMLQYGVEMVNPEGTNSNFAQTGTKPLEYYLSFSNPRSEVYTWNRESHYSIDAFAEESVAMLFNYGYQIQQIKQKNPFLNIGVAPMLQPAEAKRPITYANYFGLGVSSTSKNKALAWLFVQDATTNPSTNAKYLNATYRSPALRSLIADSTNDQVVGVFAKQALMATSWKQADSTAINASFANMLELILTGQLSVGRAISQTQTEVNEIIRRTVQ
jgi:ABC-type glycerol-3-phosphate transport system substrate-binding protein